MSDSVLVVAVVLVVSALVIVRCARTAGQALTAVSLVTAGLACIWIGAHP
jgi:hypothetical protein